MSERPYQPFYIPYGMSEEEYEYKKRIARQKLAEWEQELEEALENSEITVIIKKENEMENESIKDKKRRANLLSINDKIKSRRTGRILKCYSKLSRYNKENILVDTEYSMWDAERKKTKGYKSKEIQNMLSKTWEKK